MNVFSCLGGGGGGVNQYTAGAGAGRDEGAPAPEYFGTAESGKFSLISFTQLNQIDSLILVETAESVRHS